VRGFVLLYPESLLNMPALHPNLDAPGRRPARFSFFTGLLVFFSVFAFSMGFATCCRSFYTDDNVVAAAPFIIESARQVKSSVLPLHTRYVGGGGGTPLLGRMADGSLNPFTLGPALLLTDHPAVLVNGVAALHLALFALGGWCLSRQLKAPPWAGLVAAFSLGFSGCYWLWAPNWLGMMVPYAFLPWLVLGVVRLVSVERRRDIAAAQVLTGVALCCLFYSGMPNPILYSGMVTGIILVSWVLRDAIVPGRLFLRMIPQMAVFALIVAPLLLKAIHVYGLHGRNVPYQDWASLSLPLKSYLGLFLPASGATWTIPWAPTQPMSNLALSVGLVPAWFVVIKGALKPSALWRRDMAVLAAGLCVFVAILSPELIPGITALYQMPLFHWFRWPVRAFPAFHFLLIFLFLSLAARSHMARWAGRGLVLICMVSAIFALAWESDRATPIRGGRSWYGITYLFPDPTAWDDRTLAALRSSRGYLISLCRTEQPTAEKPRLYFHGNLGAEYRVATVGNYTVDGKISARDGIGMDYRGRIGNWEKARAFLRLSAPEPLPGPVYWDNGVEAASVAEFAAKTYIAAAAVEKVWKEPMDYFLTSTDWRLLDEKDAVALFIRSERQQSFAP
jgi:hypothetical protein